MQLAIVKGSVQATVKHEVLEQEKIMVIQPVDPNNKPVGNIILAIDKVQCGPGDLVMYVDEGNSARLILDDNMAPVRTVILAFVDEVTIES